MKNYPQKSDRQRGLQHPPVPIEKYIELAKKAKADNEEWVQRMLFSIATTGNPRLARMFVKRLRLRAVVEALDPFPFASPFEEDFID